MGEVRPALSRLDYITYTESNPHLTMFGTSDICHTHVRFLGESPFSEPRCIGTILRQNGIRDRSLEQESTEFCLHAASNKEMIK